MVDYRVEDHQVALSRSSSMTRKRVSNITGIRSAKKIALKLRLAELENGLSKKTKELEKTKGQIVELSNKVETLKGEVETSKVEHAAHIDDIMEKMMQEQAARAEFKKQSETKMVEIEKKTEETITAMTAETETSLAAIKDDWAERTRFTKDLHAHEKMLVEREMNVTLDDRDDLISFYEKECRALKKLTKSARKALKKKLSGGFFYKPKKAIEAEVAAPEPEPVVEEEEPAVELYTDFGSVEEESSIPEEVAVEDAPEVPDVVDDVVEEVIYEEVEEAVEESVEASEEASLEESVEVMEEASLEELAEVTEEASLEESAEPVEGAVYKDVEEVPALEESSQSDATEEVVEEDMEEVIEEYVREGVEEEVAEEASEATEEAVEEVVEEETPEEPVVTPETPEEPEKTEVPDIDLAKSEDIQDALVESSSEEATEPCSEEDTMLTSVVNPAEPDVEKKQPSSPVSEKSTEPLTEYSEEKTFTLSGDNVAIYDDVKAY